MIKFFFGFGLNKNGIKLVFNLYWSKHKYARLNYVYAKQDKQLYDRKIYEIKH